MAVFIFVLRWGYELDRNANNVDGWISLNMHLSI